MNEAADEQHHFEHSELQSQLVNAQEQLTASATDVEGQNKLKSLQEENESQIENLGHNFLPLKKPILKSHLASRRWMQRTT